MSPKLFFSFCLALCLATQISSQDTQELDAFLYLTKGYCYQKKLGLDPHKKGYLFKEKFTASNKVIIVAMYRQARPFPQLVGLIYEIPDSMGSKIIGISYLSSPLVQKAYAEWKHQHQSDYTHAAFLQAQEEYVFSLLNNDRTSTPTAYSSLDNDAKNHIVRTQHFSMPNDLVPKGGAKASIYKKSETMNAEMNALSANAYFRVEGNLIKRPAQRKLNQIPIAHLKGSLSGKVMIKFCINQHGAVTFAKFTQRGSTSFHPSLIEAALQAVQHMTFEPADTSEDCGMVGFDFN